MINNGECIFCDIAAGKQSCFLLYEDANCMAFLTPYPNTPGQTVVITKKHYSSYYADVPILVLKNLMQAVKHVAKMLDRAYPDVGRTAVVFEGWGIEHFHAKLYPMHGTIEPEKRPHSSSTAFFNTYPGYVTTENKYQRMSDEQLLFNQQKIIKANEK